MSRVLCFDPSGNFYEGEGTTGWALFEDGGLKGFGAIASKDYEEQEMYWAEHARLIRMFLENRENATLVMESYRVFAHKSKQQINSAMETPQLIGYLRMVAWEEVIPVIFQDPKDKLRVTDEILVREGVFEKRGNKHYVNGRSTVLHERDAIRHGIFFHRYNRKK